MGSMETDKPDRSKRNSSSGPHKTDQSSLVLKPVSPETGGKGLPYAPENWPKDGDMWGWRVGRRVASTGHYLDRYLYLPRRLKPQASMLSRYPFASKLAVERYIQAAFKNVDINAFFSMFSWRIPAIDSEGNNDQCKWVPVPRDQMAEPPEPGVPLEILSCKAGNKMCNSLMFEEVETSLAMPCDICCSEPGFCRDCCCILCCKIVDPTYGGYLHIKCQKNVGKSNICGHIAHLNCALRCHLAGTVKGASGLDAEYYCRRCDGRTDLIPHVKRLLEKCESIKSHEIVEKIFNLSYCLLRSSQKPLVKELLSRIESAISKLNCVSLEDIRKMDDKVSVSDAALNSQEESHRSFNQSEAAKLDYEVDQVLQSLGKSQEIEYNLAKERLHAQKNYLSNLCQQLEWEKSELARRVTSTDPDLLVGAVKDRRDQIKLEFMKLKDMVNIGRGFGKTRKDILKKHFSLDFKEDTDNSPASYDRLDILP